MLLRTFARIALFGGAVAMLGLPAPAGEASPGPGSFRVGAAVESLDPSMPVYAGGFGASPPITRIHDPLQVRALYVSNGGHAVAFAVVDAQAEFAAYQEGPHYGIADARRVAAKRISRLGGPKVGTADVIVQGTHSHSAPTLEGIWGPVPPAYLKLVHDRTVAALVEAARQARPATLAWATVNAPELDNIDTQQTDSYPGWAQDGQVSVLRATDRYSGASISTFVNVPAHPDIVCGACLKLLSADYFGVARRLLDEQLGGVNVVGPATLGREESPVQTAGLAQSQWYGRTVANLVTGALTHAQPVDDGTIQSTQSFVRVAATNPALVFLNESWKLPDEQKQQMLDATGIYPIDRSVDPPYATGNVIGTDLTSVRIGNLLYMSQPGEPFPEIRNTIRRAVQGADMIVALSKGQDDWGYYYPSWVEPFTAAYPSDHGIYNVAPQAGDQIIEQSILNAADLGFDTAPGVPTPMGTAWDQASKPAIQALASPPTGDAGPDGTFTVRFEAVYEPAYTNPAPLDGKVHWDFGDGTTGTSDYLSFGEGKKKPAFVEHAYAPGRYTAKVSGQDTNGNAMSWTVPVRVFPQLHAHISDWELPTCPAHESCGAPDFYVRPGLSVSWRGGDGHAIAIRWTDGRGEELWGPQGPPSDRCPCTVFVTDGTGTIATARWNG